MNKKGFTLIELIATITIMVMITIIAIPTSIKFIEKGKQNQYDILEDQIISAANKYYINHKDDKCITIDELKNTNLLNEVDDKFINNLGNIINPKTNKTLNEQVKVTINGNKVTYKLVASCS